MSDPKDDLHFVEAAATANTQAALASQAIFASRRVDERELFYPDRAGRVEQSWAKQVVMQYIAEWPEAEGVTVVRRKGVIVAIFDEDG